ncbi:glycine-rich domain-containing protein [Streptomyces mirabilis]|uniref:glycine-rich domain-containing protein n=1 Tax=Streptomyces mirabilis TaxID=68239 RepID=UPI0036D9880F
MTIALERPVGTTDPLTLVDPEVTERLARRVTADHPDIGEATARRIVGQAAAFIAASGQQPGRDLVPSKLVDYGWHAFILHTVDYAAFCRRVVGRFVHHVPTDEDEQVPGGAAAARERTTAAIEAAGYAVDTDLWPTDSGECSQCHAGCTDSPNGGKGKK